MVEPDRPQKTVERMRFACWKTEFTDTLRIAFSGRQLFRDGASVLRLYVKYIASLVFHGVQDICGARAMSHLLCTGSWVTEIRENSLAGARGVEENNTQLSTAHLVAEV